MNTRYTEYATRDAILELRDVSKDYGEGAAQVAALRHASLRVDGGTMVAVPGPESLPGDGR